MYHSRIYSAKVISSTLMYLLFKSIPLMIIIIIIIIIATMAQLGADIQFKDNAVKLGGEKVDAEWKPTWKKVKESFKK